MNAQLHFIRLDDPETSIQSPALSALLRDGWYVVAHFVGEREGTACLVLVLSPPRPQPESNQVKVLVATCLILLAASIAVFLGAA